MKEEVRILVRIGIAAVAVALLSTLCSARTNRQREFEVRAYITVAREGLFKFVVAISSKAGICTGSILNKDWVLTAAHCFYHQDKQIENNAARIIAGAVNYETSRGNIKQETMSEEIKVHPSFWYNRISKYDIALVRVKHPFQFNEYVGSIAVAGDGWPQTDNQSDTCMCLGFGGTRDVAMETADLKTWNVTAEHSERACYCARRFEYKRIACVKENVRPQICSGDDGGPLVCGNVVRAIAHMVWNRYTCEDPTYPSERCVESPERGLSTYMFLCPFNNWMRKSVPEVPKRPASCKASLISSSLGSLAILSVTVLPPLFS